MYYYRKLLPLIFDNCTSMHFFTPPYFISGLYKRYFGGALHGPHQMADVYSPKQSELGGSEETEGLLSPTVPNLGRAL